MSDEQGGGGLHIDGDWKTEAAREKQRLAEQEAKAQRGASSGQEPPVGFVELINLLAMQAAIGLGGMQGPGGERIPPNPIAAQHHIDLLELLRQKTEGNLSDEESRTLAAVLYELRQQYIQVVAGPPVKDPAKTGQ